MNRLDHVYPIKFSLVLSLDELVSLSEALQLEIENRLNYYDEALCSEQTLFLLIGARQKINSRMYTISRAGKQKGKLTLYLIEYRTIHQFVIRSPKVPLGYNYFYDARAKIDQLLVNHY